MTSLQEVPAPSTLTRSVVEVENLSVRIRTARGPITVVSGVSYEVAPSEALALVGESGAGKSSRPAVLGLLDPKKFDVEGRVFLNGVDLSSLNAKQRRHHVTSSASLIFQDPTRSLNPTMRVGWQIAEAMYKVRGREGSLDKAGAKERALELMRDVGIADPAERFYSFPHELSGGMRQRIVIAIALACQPKIIFADEPTTSLDVTTQAQIMDLIDELRSRFEIAVVLITHDLALAASRVDEVMVMYAGKLVEKLSAVDLSAHARMPYTQALLRAVPADTDEQGEIPDPIPGNPPDPLYLPSGCAFHPRCSRAGAGCDETAPPLAELAPGHLSACWYPAEPVESAVLVNP